MFIFTGLLELACEPANWVFVPVVAYIAYRYSQLVVTR